MEALASHERRGMQRPAHRMQHCKRLHPLLPTNASDVNQWVIYDAPPRHGGLGDWLASLISAFLLSIIMKRRFFVRSPFGELADFSPYDVPPPGPLPSGIVVGDKLVGQTFYCLEPSELRKRLQGNLTEKGRIVYFRGQHRACASTWAPMLAPLWRALVGHTEASFAHLDRHPAVLYGCILQLLFKPGPAVVDVLSVKAILTGSTGRTVGVHMRFGDYYRLRRTGSCAAGKTTEQSSRMSAFIEGLLELPRVAFASSSSLPVTYRVEADDICVREAITQGLQARGQHVTSPIAADTGPGLGAENLAAWFAFAASDTFALLPLCERWGTRLSGWSAMALLYAQQQSFHRICDVYARRPLCASASAINCSIAPRSRLLARPHNDSEREAEVHTRKQALSWTVANFA